MAFGEYWGTLKANQFGMLPDDNQILDSLEECLPLSFTIVNKTALEPVWDELIRTHHYLGFGKMIGQSIKYLVMAGERPLVALSYNRASLHVGARDEYIGWNDEGRQLHLDDVICNHRFLILPWINVKNLASHILAKSLHLIRRDWKEHFGREPKIVETFVDKARYKGTCYLAANFKYVGDTKGYGKHGNMFEYHGNKKMVFIYELDKTFVKSIAPHLRRTLRPAQPEKSDPRESQEMLKSFPEKIDGVIELSENTMAEIRKDYAKYLEEYSPCFNHCAQPVHFEHYVSGLMSTLERKSIEPIALNYAEIVEGEGEGEEDKIKTCVRTLQYFMQASPWSLDLMTEIHHSIISKEIGDKDVILTLDGCDFPKKGEESPGVGRQHCGPLGKTDNCQASVMIGYVGQSLYGLLDSRLYMLKSWFKKDHRERWEKCGIPDDLTFKTKNQIAIDLLKSVCEKGVLSAKWVVADGAFGHDSNFIDSIPETLNYFLEVHSSDTFYLNMPEIVEPIYSGVGRKPSRQIIESSPLKVETIIKNYGGPWKKAVFGVGSMGPETGHYKLLRVLDTREGRPNKWIWLFAKKTPGKVKYSISNAPEGTPIEKFFELSGCRWVIEQCFEESKMELGMDHFEGRSWIGWHRHMHLVRVAHLFLQIIRLKYAAEHSQLPKNGKELYDKLQLDEGKKIVILTTSQARDICYPASINDKSKFMNALISIKWNARGYWNSFFSRCKKVIIECPWVLKKLFRRRMALIEGDTH
jgi:SRSO17 transposase